MNINWKLRFQNKTTLVAIILQAVTLLYGVLALFGITPGVGQEEITNVLYILVELLCLLGIVVDPTTKGVGDSENALMYTQPK
ncbi:MAG: phage holin [Oscillospiraceae bacterium]|nr:phage holin [Oscillospiraceae bacterium]